MKYYLYCRKSSEDAGKQVQSIEDQLNWGKKEALRRNLQIVEVFTETKSAKEPGRPQFTTMVNGIQNGEADGVICWKLDRLARNPVDGGQISWLLQSRSIRHIIAHDRDYYPEDNVLMMSVEFGMANQFVRDLGASSSRGMRSRAEKGWFPGKAPLGYLNVGHEGAAEIQPDPERFDLVRQLWKIGLKGEYSLERLCQESKSWGLKTHRVRGGSWDLAKSTLQTIFTNPFYSGDFLFKGELMEGKHQPMINRAEFEHMQKLLGRRGRPCASKRAFDFAGFMSCGQCGSAITAEGKTKQIKSTGRIRSYVYYHCSRSTKAINCKQPSLEQKELERQFVDFLETLTIPTDFIDWIITYMHEMTGEEIHDRQAMLNATQNQIDKVAKKLDNLIQMRLESLLTDDEFIAQKNHLMIEKKNLLTRLEELSQHQDSWIHQADASFQFVKNLAERFNEGSIKQKREILSSVGSNWAIMDKKVHVEAKGQFLPIHKGCLETREILSKFEPQEGLTEAKNSIFDQLCTVWLPILDEVRTYFRTAKYQFIPTP